ncbi:MAG: hypothetical protein M0Z59_06380 [Nitrospiraceae bacterium]|nr:hypothetical protein [Nitrospiraceae bacterium]
MERERQTRGADPCGKEVGVREVINRITRMLNAFTELITSGNCNRMEMSSLMHDISAQLADLSYVIEQEDVFLAAEAISAIEEKLENAEKRMELLAIR